MISTRSIFDSLCAEYLGPLEAAKAVSHIIESENKTFESILIGYFSILKKEKLYWLEGLFDALYQLSFASEEAREYILSYRWENLILEKPFCNKGYLFSGWHDIIEKRMHQLVDHVREIQNANCQNQPHKSFCQRKV